MIRITEGEMSFEGLCNKEFSSTNRSERYFGKKNQKREGVMDGLEGILETILDILDLPGTESEKDELIAKTVIGLYDSLVGKYRPLVKGASPLVEKLIYELMPVMNALYRSVVIIKSDPTIQLTATENKKLNAKSRIENLKIHQKAGFTRAEAMMLVLQDIANTDYNIKGFSKNTASSLKK